MPVFLCGFFHIEIVLKQSCRGMYHAVKEFFPWRMHQYLAGLVPFRYGIIHRFFLLRVRARDKGERDRD